MRNWNKSDTNKIKIKFSGNTCKGTFLDIWADIFYSGTVICGAFIFCDLDCICKSVTGVFGLISVIGIMQFLLHRMYLLKTVHCTFCNISF